jgi:hypothetical protein
MDDETQVFLHGAYEFLQAHQQAIVELRIGVLALRNTIQELGPEAEQIYAKHYTAASQGEIKIAGDLTLQGLALVLQQLRGAN